MRNVDPLVQKWSGLDRLWEEIVHGSSSLRWKTDDKRDSWVSFTPCAPSATDSSFKAENLVVRSFQRQGHQREKKPLVI